MRKILPVFLALLLFLAFRGSALAAPVSIDPIISSSQAAGSPVGDCIGPDGNHFQATKEVCDTFNKAWGKTAAPIAIGQPSPLPPTTPLSVVVAQAQAAGSPQIDCVGPDKKVLKAAKEVCDKLNIDWKKAPAAPIVISATAASSSDLSQTIKTSLEKGSPLGDCVGPDKKHFDATKEVCDTFTKSWGKTTPSFNPAVTTGVGIQSSGIVSSPSKSSGGSSAGSSNSSSGGSGSSNSNSNNSSSGGGSSSGSTVSSPSHGSSAGSSGGSSSSGGSKSSGKGPKSEPKKN